MIRLLAAAALFAVATASSHAGDLTPRGAFDRAFDWVKSDLMIDGYIVSRREAASHRATGKSGDTILGKVATLSPDGQSLKWGEETVAVGGHLTALPEYYFRGVEDGKIIIQLAWLYDNTDAAEALMQMYDATGEDRYLREADPILREAYSKVGPDGRYVLHLADQKPVYRAMSHAILMRGLDQYEKRSGEQWAADALRRMAEAYEHSTEGTWNHWTNSFMGMLIAARFGLVDDETLARMNHNFDEFIDQIKSQKGVIPYIMNAKDERWPAHKRTYQSYDLLLLLRLVQMDDRFRQPVCEIFAAAFREAIKVNAKYYAGRNTQSAWLGQQLCGLDNQAFLDKEMQRVVNDPVPGKIDKALQHLLTAAAYLNAAAE